MKPIDRGGSVSGWIRFRIPNGKQALEDFQNGRVAMKIHFRDVMDNGYDIACNMSHTESDGPMYIPGTNNLSIGSKKTTLQP